MKGVEGGTQCSAGSDLGWGHAARGSGGARSSCMGNSAAFSQADTTVRAMQTLASSLPPTALSCSSPFSSLPRLSLPPDTSTHTRLLARRVLSGLPENQAPKSWVTLG